MSSTSCRYTKNSFFYNKGAVAHCCVQKTLFIKNDWSDIDDLNQFYNHNRKIKKVRTDLDTGIQHSACQTCWVDEEKYNSSMRTLSDNYFDSADDGIANITHVDLRLSNKCNLQCRMCNPFDSDQLDIVSKKLSKKGIRHPLEKMQPFSVDSTKVLELVTQLPNLKLIKLAGGEPFIMPEVQAFLSRLIELKKTDVTIELITNCTSAKQEIIELLKKFHRVEIICSIDGIEETIEYQRFPVKWKTVESVFSTFYNSNFHLLQIHPCIGMLNFLTLDKFFKWTEQYPTIPIGYNEIYEPSFLNFRYIPLDVRTEFLERFSNVNIFGDPKWEKFKTETMYEYLEPSKRDCKMLYEYSQKIWDSRGKYKFLELYPWAEYMITKSGKK